LSLPEVMPCWRHENKKHNLPSYDVVAGACYYVVGL
jgi:hypothetical protein